MDADAYITRCFRKYQNLVSPAHGDITSLSGVYDLRLSDRAPDYLVMSTHVLKQRWITMARKDIMPSLCLPPDTPTQP